MNTQDPMLQPPLVEQLTQTTAAVLEEEAKLVREMVSILSGDSNLAPQGSDRRFADEAWKSNPYMKMWMQGYLAWTESMGQLINQTPLSGENRERARFALSLLTDAAAPTNTLLGSPAAMKKMVDTGGASVVQGLQNMLGDVIHNNGMPTQVDKSQFKVGGNVAATPGSVVMRNEQLELMQYTPTTAKVFARPLLLVPPQINKYYVFDLAPGKSIIEYLVAQGFQVFAISWRNPGPEKADWGMDTYVAAILEAMDAVLEITGSKDLIINGACAGAMTMAALLGHQAAKKVNKVHAATFMVSILDSLEGSQLGMFTTPQVLDMAKQASSKKGVIEGSEMGRVFAWLRPNDLVWNYWVNNYLLGNPPPAFDVLFWNNDTTRLPAKFHANIIDCFGERKLATPGAMTVLGEKIDLGKVKCDAYVLAGITDHITPWQGVFNATQYLGGKSEFVLSSSGHVQSLVAPPGNPKSKFYANSKGAKTAQAWLEGAQTHPGTWWEHWREWLKARAGKPVKAPTALGSKAHPAMEAAPGTYVLEK